MLVKKQFYLNTLNFQLAEICHLGFTIFGNLNILGIRIIIFLHAINGDKYQWSNLGKLICDVYHFDEQLLVMADQPGFPIVYETLNPDTNYSRADQPDIS